MNKACRDKLPELLFGIAYFHRASGLHSIIQHYFSDDAVVQQVERILPDIIGNRSYAAVKEILSP